MMSKTASCVSARQEFQRNLARQIERSGKTQVEIANALGYPNANIVAMFKNGTMRLPPGKVAPFALALGHAPGQMLREWFIAYMPDVLADIDAHMSGHALP